MVPLRIEALLAALTDRQREFVQLIRSGVPQNQAAVQAGYSPRSAPSMASRLVRNPKIQQALELLDEQDRPGGDPTKDGEDNPVLRELWAIAKTGTPAARVSALAHIERIWSTRHALTEVARRETELAQKGFDGILLELLRELRGIIDTEHRYGRGPEGAELRAAAEALAASLHAFVHRADGPAPDATGFLAKYGSPT